MVFKIKIINPNHKDDYYIDNETIESVNYAFEGGNFLYNSENSIIVSIKNCSGDGIEVTNIKVLDDNQKVVNTFSTNKMGFGKFTINNPKNIRYKIVAENKFSSKNQSLTINIIFWRYICISSIINQC